MKRETIFQEGNVVTWQYDGMQAIGIVDGYSYISVALNYKMDSNIKEGDLWYYDDIYTDEGSDVRLATMSERFALIMALHKRGEHFVCCDDKIRFIPKTEGKE